MPGIRRGSTFCIPVTTCCMWAWRGTTWVVSSAFTSFKSDCGTSIGYVLAITHTTVANAVFTLGTIPFFTAVIAWLILGERVDRVTAVAIVLAFAGISLMVGDGVAAGTVFGSLMAIITAFCFACFVVVLRKGRAANMLPAVAIGALFAALVAEVLEEQLSRRGEKLVE